MRDLLLEEVFSLLEEATKLEKTGRHRIEAATKYYESCYLMRQIVANPENHAHSNDSDAGRSSRRLLHDKIDHYTKRARKLYFDESIADTRPTASRKPSKQDSQPATSVMVELLDDAISVLTDIPSVPQANPVPVSVLSAKPATKNIFSHSAMPHRNNGARDTNHHEHQQDRKNIKLRQPYRRSKTPRCAIATTERRIHLQANLAHSILSKAMDMDEKRFGNPRILHQAIESYVEASELYLSAIQLGSQHIHRLEEMQNDIQRRTSSTDGSSKQLVDTTRNNLQSLLQKLKRLVSSALDRIEILKHEQRHQNRYPKDSTKSSSRLSVVTFTTPPSSKRSSAGSCSPLQPTWFAAKENHRNSRVIDK